VLARSACLGSLLATLFDVGFFAAMVRIATPLILATLGELYSERSGVLNLGIEGIMLLGAMIGFTAAYFTGISFLWYNVIGCLVVVGTALALSAGNERLGAGS
jgi:simple sugar transport system permease protein